MVPAKIQPVAKGCLQNKEINKRVNEHSCYSSLVLAFFPAKFDVAGLVAVVADPELDGVVVADIGEDILQFKKTFEIIA